MDEKLRREIFRYLGYRSEPPEAGVAETIGECTAELQRLCEPKRIFRFFPLEWTGEDSFQIEGMMVSSRDLARNLKGCREVCLFGATLGLAPDRLSARASAVGRMSRAVILQAAAAALIEAWCDEVNEEIRREASKRGLYLRPRFSPGYGDFALEHQTELFRILNLQKNIGVTLTESLLMLPTKSVTALIGLTEENGNCVISGCESCMKTDCSYRRG